MSATITYRKTRTGQWVAYGPKAEVRIGEITVTRRDGTTEVRRVTSVGKDFRVDGTTMRYGYLAPAPRSAQTTTTRTTTARPARSSSRECRRCGCTDPSCGGSGSGICRGPSFDPCFDCRP